MAHILIVDDESAFTSGIAQFLRRRSHDVSVANTLSGARGLLRERIPEYLLLDLMLPDGSGLELLDAFEQHRPNKIIIITGNSGVKTLIAGMAGERVAYLTKPVEPRDLLGLLDTTDIDVPPQELDESMHFGVLLGESRPMQDIYSKIRQVGPTDSTVFIQGESGTGKELVAEAVHRVSHRNGAFVPVNCGGLAQDLVSTQLFGHEKGSFTGATKRHIGFFERAHQGTLFLDEVTEMPIEMQTHLLRALESGRILRLGSEGEIDVDVRLIAATNRDPAQAVREGLLREDLYFRLRVFPIELPALRERVGDVKLLAEHFLRDLNEKYQTNKTFSSEAIQSLERHTWPGNVRELKHAVHRAYILGENGCVEVPADLEDALPRDVEGLRVGRSIADVEKDLILTTLAHHDGDKKAAAAILGVSLKTLYNRLKEYGEDRLPDGGVPADQ